MESIVQLPSEDVGVTKGMEEPKRFKTLDDFNFQIICAFPSIGKSTYCAKHPHTIDFDSGIFDSAGFKLNDLLNTLSTLLFTESIIFLNDPVLLQEFLRRFSRDEFRIIRRKTLMVLPSYDVDEAVRRLIARGDDPSIGFVPLIKQSYEKWVEGWNRIADKIPVRVVWRKTITRNLFPVTKWQLPLW